MFSPLVGMVATDLAVLASQIRTDLSPDAVACRNTKVIFNFFKHLFSFDHNKQILHELTCFTTQVLKIYMLMSFCRNTKVVAHTLFVFIARDNVERF